jgi:hypothetical protein
MTKKTDNIYIIFGLMILFLISIYFFSQKEGYYGYDPVWDESMDGWAPCISNFHAVAIGPKLKKCCKNDSIWDASLSICHPECTEGKIWNIKTNSCQLQCPKEFPMYKGNSRCGNPGKNDDVNSLF